MSEYSPQFYPGTTEPAVNRRKYMDPSYTWEKLRSISDEDVVRLLGHRAPGEAYGSVHPPLEEMKEPDDPIRKLVEPTPGAKAGDRVRYVQLTDSVYLSPFAPFTRTWAINWRYRGLDTGVLSGRNPVEGRERDVEKAAKDLIETEVFDPARTAVRGYTVHGHALRLDENGLMFDAVRRYTFDKEKGVVVYIKDQIGVPLDKNIEVGKPLTEEELKKRTTQFRADHIKLTDDKDLVKYIYRTFELRARSGFNPEGVKGL
ncbi:MAG: coenzyme-B sulfoethylthiotransferase subunit gamma [archaeon]|nr:coenzyme-B sulfoethylthiotransferase subunit gamma [archaeon]MCP8306797.1 coenzyme-B sulfoethylthiotransferase subunit gamma [archaeon]